MLELSQTMLRRVKRRDKAARWVVTFGGVAVILSVLAILVLIVGVTLPLFQPARVRVIARSRLPAGIVPKDVVALGVEAGLDDSKPLVAHLLIRDGGVTSSTSTTGASCSGIGWSRRPASRTKPVQNPPPRQIRAAETIGPGTYTLVWSDGAISLVEIVSETPGGKGKQAERRAIRPHCGRHPAGKGPNAAPRRRPGVEGEGRNVDLRRRAPEATASS